MFQLIDQVLLIAAVIGQEDHVGRCGLLIELLHKGHERETFDCGAPELNAWLRTQARQEMERGAAVVYVLTPQQPPNAIAGFYTL